MSDAFAHTSAAGAALLCLPLLCSLALHVPPPAQAAEANPKSRTPTTGPATMPVLLKHKRDEADDFFDGPLPRFRIEIAPDQWEQLKRDNRKFVRATVIEMYPGRPDTAWPDTGVHLKGGPGSSRPLDNKPALTLKFDQFTPNRRFHGLTKIHLNNSVQDPTFMHETIARELFREAGIPAPRVTNTRVWINGRDWGPYVLIEGFNRVFLKRFFKDDDGVIYDANFADVDQQLRPMTPTADKKGADTRLLAAAARETDPVKRREALEKILDLDRFLSFMAVEHLIADWDGYCGNRNNTRLYFEPTAGKFVFLPHGKDQVFGDPNFPLIRDAGLLARAVTQAPEDRQRYLERVRQLRQTIFDPDKLTARVQQLTERILPLMREIGPHAEREFLAQSAGLRARIVARARGVDRLLNLPTQYLKFDSHGIARLAGWQPHMGEQHGPGTSLDIVAEGSTRLLRIRAGNGGCVASFRTSVVLPPGRYVFEGRCRTSAVAANPGENSGAGLRISGARRPAGLAGDTPWRDCAFEFEAADADVVLVCELRAQKGEAYFDLESLRLRRK